MSEVRADQLPDGIASDVVETIPAASVIVMRGVPLEVLLIRRNDSSAFVPGAWIFPGGAIDDADRDVVTALGIVDDEGPIGAAKVCGIRETLEEAGVWLGAAAVDPLPIRAKLAAGQAPLEPFHVEAAMDGLVLTSRWVTPEGMPRRYDTWFFLAEAPPGCEPEVDGSEGVELRWITPSAALESNRRKELKLLFPTIRNLESLLAFEDAAAALKGRGDAHVPVHRPVVIREGGRTRIALPGEE